MKAIETEFAGYKFRSRTEARWAVFFATAGIQFEYEKEGFELGGQKYLPDFWLPSLDLWFEVKGQEPTEAEINLCEELAKQSGKPAIIAVGYPSANDQLIAVGGIERIGYGYWHFADDRFEDRKFWLISDKDPRGAWAVSLPFQGFSEEQLACWDDAEKQAGLNFIFEELARTAFPTGPYVHSRTRQGYLAARQARFEHGEQPGAEYLATFCGAPGATNA